MPMISDTVGISSIYGGEDVNSLRLEIAANGLGSALAAQEGGADRVELFADLAAGGTTPSAGTIAAARAALKMDLHVLIRPRAGDFVYSSAEREAMLRDVEYCARVGCDGEEPRALSRHNDFKALPGGIRDNQGLADVG